MKNKLIFGLIIAPTIALAAEVPDVAVGPFDFDEVPTREAIRTILSSTDISPAFQLPPAGVVTAKNVKGQLPDVLKHLSSAVGFTYSYKDKVLTISQQGGAKANKLAPVVIPKPVVSISLIKGKSVKSALEEACKQHGYTFTWEGQDLYSKYNAQFEAESFEAAVNDLLVAVRTNGYAPKGRKELYVVVQ